MNLDRRRFLGLAVAAPMAAFTPAAPVVVTQYVHFAIGAPKAVAMAVRATMPRLTYLVRGLR